MFGGTPQESGVAFQISKQDLPGVFEFFADETKAKKEASEGVLFVVTSLILGGDALGILCHVHKLIYELLVGLAFRFVAFSVEPGQADSVIIDMDRKLTNLKRLLEKCGLAFDELCESFKSRGFKIGPLNMDAELFG